MSKASNLAGFVTSISPVNNLNVGVMTASNHVNVGTGVTIHHTNGVQVGGNTVHSTGLNINQLNATGVVTSTSAIISNVIVSSGIVTAVSGIVTYYGDGSNLNLTGNTTAGVSEGKVFFISARR